MYFDPTPLILIFTGLAGGVLLTWYFTRLARGRHRDTKTSRFRTDRVVTQTIAERVRAVGKLVALEVFAKEIATASTGWAWLPPILLSQARIAMIFNFERQYFVDLGRVRATDVSEVTPEDGEHVGEEPRKPVYRLTLPPLEGQLRLIDVTPYDIQNARVLGLVDVIPMTADRQRDLMKRAQDQAAEMYKVNDRRYITEAKNSAERHLRSLMELFGVKIEIVWADEVSPTQGQATASVPAPVSEPPAVEARLGRAKLAV